MYFLWSLFFSTPILKSEFASFNRLEVKSNYEQTVMNAESTALERAQSLLTRIYLTYVRRTLTKASRVLVPQYDVDL